MDEQEYSFRAEIMVDDRDAIFKQLRKASTQLSAAEASVIIDDIRQRFEATSSLRWNGDQGRLQGEVTIKVPADCDMDDPMTEESVVVNYQESVAADFAAVIVEQITAIRAGGR